MTRDSRMVADRPSASMLARLCALAAFLASASCSTFEMKTAPGLVRLQSPGPRFAYRALAPEGVVVAVRVIDVGGGDLAFWTRATTLRMRQLDGYALLASSDVKSRDGTPGRELRFGHDEGGKPYLYAIRIFYVVRGSLFGPIRRVVLLETGGPRVEVERYAASVEWMESSLFID
jgi:hypothetical protein